MNRISLLFNNAANMKAFQAQLNVDYMEMNSRTLIIICECTLKDVELAIKNYGATIIGSTDSISYNS